ncbi:hypothetical protein SA2016_3478 [Sinomonas atrocyanea]|uniref:Uncharacterized protein n=1 Tax=Sinomonas atrocyanea TaxID=37927 RepID=A0A127A3T5_9MICC|nr:hypothetical protein [Sinomonas atrocyanea]AMM34138.1 hypothetical protein SA2016_3478 [Sinomonas atrocyanea]GGG58459.1 hypothetical protein GCM10007172_06660 [Sinomonas atrocyanea]
MMSQVHPAAVSYVSPALYYAYLAIAIVLTVRAPTRRFGVGLLLALGLLTLVIGGFLLVALFSLTS